MPVGVVTRRAMTTKATAAATIGTIVPNITVDRPIADPIPRANLYFRDIASNSMMETKVPTNS